MISDGDGGSSGGGRARFGYHASSDGGAYAYSDEDYNPSDEDEMSEIADERRQQAPRGRQHASSVDGGGFGGSGATGLGHTTDATTPHPVVGPLADARVVRIVAGHRHSFALTEDGRVFGFGRGGGVPAGGAQVLPQLLQGALADTTVRALGVGCFASHSVLVAGPPPAEPGFELPLVFAMQKPAAHEPSADAIAAAAALKPPQQRDESGGAAAARAPAAPPLKAAAQGTKRKHEEEDDEDESSASEEDGSAAEAEPLC